MHGGACTGRGTCAVRTVGNGAHGGQHNVVTATAADRRSLHTLRKEPRAAIGAIMPSSGRSRRSAVVRSRACDLYKATAS